MRSLFTWLGRHEIAVLGALVLAAAGLWGFAELADEVLEGTTRGFDERVLLAMRSASDPADPLGPVWLEEGARDLTALGGVAVLALATMSVALYLALLGKVRAMLLLLGAVGGGLLVSTALKLGFDRPRPDLVPHASEVFTASFPSGHSMMAAVTWLTLAVLLARVHSSLRIRAYVLVLAVLITVAVGVSRVYVGVHWPTDVLAGWTAGIAWATACWLVASWLQRRGQLEGSDGLPPGT